MSAEQTETEIPIEWHIPESLPSHYVHNMVVQHNDFDFVVSFFVTKPPLIVGTPSKEFLDTLKSVRAECVAQIVVAAGRMPNFLQALQTNYDKWLAARNPVAPETLVE